MTKKVLIGQDDIKDIYRMTLSACDMHNADSYAANLFSRVLCDWIVAQPVVIMATYTAEPGREDLEVESVLSKMETTDSGVTIEEIKEIIKEYAGAVRSRVWRRKNRRQKRAL